MDNEIFQATLIGKAPLLMHNGRLSNPEDPATKELAKVSKGKAKDLVKAARAEFMGSLYLDESGDIAIPVDCILACVIAGAKAYKQGKSAAAGVYPADAEFFPLVYKGPRDPVELFEDKQFVDSRGVRVQMSRVQRTRPIFREWKLPVTLEFDPTLFGRDDLTTAIERAGKAIGIGDYRPRYGRFTVEVAS